MSFDSYKVLSEVHFADMVHGARVGMFYIILKLNVTVLVIRVMKVKSFENYAIKGHKRHTMVHLLTE